MSFSIRLLGPPLVERDGERLAFETKKAMAVIAYLAVSQTARSRDEVAMLLWPDTGVDRARGALRRTLSAIRTAVAPDEALAGDRSYLELRADVDVDIRSFRHLVARVREHAEKVPCTDCIENAESAVALYAGDFLAGFSPRDATEFDEWRFLETEALRRELLWILQRLVEALASSSPDRALEYATRWLSVDPLQEEAHAWVMRLHAARGDRTAAVQQYRECVRILSEELGVAPLEETTALYRQIAQGAQPASGVRIPAVTTVGQEVPLVERSGEVQTMTHAFEATRHEGRLLVIEGEPGIGKTRLADELLALVRPTGGTTIQVQAHEEERDHAYGTVARALRAVTEEAPVRAFGAVSDVSLAEAARLVPDLRLLRPEIGRPPPLSDPGAKTTFFESLWDTLAAALESLDRPVVFLDDLHWADQGSIEFLTLLTRRVRELPGLLVLSWRSGEVPRGAVLRRAAAAAVRSGHADHIGLRRLSKPSVATLLAAVGAPADESTVERVFSESEGVPFFVIEYAKAIGRSGDVDLRARAHELVTARLASLSDRTRQILSTASVVGRSFDFNTLVTAAGRSEDETVDALDELTTLGILRELASASGPIYDFTHELIRRATYEATSLARRRLLHRRVADYLMRVPGLGSIEDVALAAHHLSHAGQEMEAARLHLVAAEQARDLFANAEALRHLEQALALGHPDTANVQEQMGDMRTLLGRYEEALVSYEIAAAVADPAWRVERKLGSLRMRLGDTDLARRHLERAALSDDPVESARAIAELSLALAAEGLFDEAVRSAEIGLDVALASGDASARAEIHNIRGLLARRRGDTDQALIELEQSLVAAEEVDDPSPRIATLNNLALTFRQTGNLPEAVRLTQDALELCTRRGDLHRQAALHNNLADLLHEAGRSEESRVHAKQAAALFGRVGEEPTSVPEIWKLTAW